MTKKILIECLKKSKWTILMSTIMLFFLYDEVDIKVFLYFCFLQLWITLQEIFRSEMREFANAASKMIVVIKSNLDELKKIYQELVDGLNK